MRIFIVIISLFFLFSADAEAGFGKKSHRFGGLSSGHHYGFATPKRSKIQSTRIGRYQAKNVLGRRVYQQKIDWHKKDDKGFTNKELAQKGRAPIGKDGH